MKLVGNKEDGYQLVSSFATPAKKPKTDSKGGRKDNKPEPHNQESENNATTPAPGQENSNNVAPEQENGDATAPEQENGDATAPDAKPEKENKKGKDNE